MHAKSDISLHTCINSTQSHARSPEALLGLLPVPRPGKEGEFGMGSVIPSHKKR